MPSGQQLGSPAASSCFASALIARRLRAVNGQSNINDSTDAKRTAAGEAVKVQETDTIVGEHHRNQVVLRPVQTKSHEIHLKWC